MMEWFNILRARMRALFRRESVLQDIEEELRAHIEMATEENLKRGRPPDEARAAALKSFGNHGRNTELCYDIRGGGWLEMLWQDLRHGARMLVKNPGFTLLAVLTLALGIGANTAIFSVVEAVLLRSLPVSEPDRLVLLRTVRQEGINHDFSYPMYQEYRDRNEVLVGLAAYSTTTLSLQGSDQTERINGEIVSGNYFGTLGVSAAAGRTFLPEEDRTPGSHPVVVISHSLWRRYFGADHNLADKMLRLNGQTLNVIGVAPKEFNGGDIASVTEVWIPAMMQPKLMNGANLLQERGASWLKLIGRLKPGISMAQAQLSMSALDGQLRQASSGAAGEKLTLAVGRQGDSLLPDDLSRPLFLLMAGVGLILLIGCANVANLMLVRSSARYKEISIRQALGASRARLIRQWLVEGGLLALFGGTAGLLLAWWLKNSVISFAIWKEFVPAAIELNLNWRVLAFTLTLSIASLALCGLVPALSASRTDLVSTLKDATILPGRHYRFALRKLLIVAQVALSVLLLIGAGLVVRSLQKLSSIDPGFKPENLLAISVDPESAGYDKAKGREFYRQLEERVQALPGVRSVSLASVLPINRGGSRTTVYFEGRDAGQDIDFRATSDHYFQTLGIPLLRGRDFNAQDQENSPEVVVINETMARLFFPSADPVGKRIFWNRKKTASAEVIGVAKDGKYRSLREEAQPTFYAPVRQLFRGQMTLHIRTTVDPNTMVGQVRKEVQTLDPSLPIFSVKTLAEHIDQALAQERMLAWLGSSFGLLALLLAATGLYGVIDNSVLQQTKELGIRMALGAQRRDILKLVVGQGMLLALIGVSLGAMAAFALTRLMKSLLFEVSATDPTTFALIVLALAGVSLVACYLPARRATKVDPKIALRVE